MDKQVALAVAGSGKTRSIIERIDPSARGLLITYTDNNLRNLRVRVLERFGHLPDKLLLCSYFSFLYSHCFKPFLWSDTRAKGIIWKMPPPGTLRLPRNHDRYYFDKSNRAYHNRLAKLLEVRSALGMLRQRLEKYYDYMLIDEFQDFAGHDFNLILGLVESKLHLQVYAAGDFHQHTFDTSRDGNVNAGLHDDVLRYKARLEGAGFDVDTSLLTRSYRCSPSVCGYVTDKLGVEIQSHRTDATKVTTLESSEEARRVFVDSDVPKLFYQKHYDYDCRGNNWGASKGNEYAHVCVVLNKTTYRSLTKEGGPPLNPRTRNKLYVACTRGRGDLYIVSEELIRSCRF